MQLPEQWVIQLIEGQLLQGFSIGPKEIQVSWYMPNNPGKTSQGKKGPVIFNSEPKAQALLLALQALVGAEFSKAVVASYQPPKGN
jgi:hypothetical protein